MEHTVISEQDRRRWNVRFKALERVGVGIYISVRIRIVSIFTHCMPKQADSAPTLVPADSVTVIKLIIYPS